MLKSARFTVLALAASTLTSAAQAGGVPLGPTEIGTAPPPPLGYGEARLTQIGGFQGTVPMKLQGNTLVLASNTMNHAVKYRGELKCPGGLDAREFGYRTSYASAHALDEYTGQPEWQDSFFAWTFTEETLETQCRAALEANPDKTSVKIDLQATADDEVAYFAWCRPPGGSSQTAWYFDSEDGGNQNLKPRSRVTCKREGMARIHKVDGKALTNRTRKADAVLQAKPVVGAAKMQLRSQSLRIRRAD